MESVTVRNKIGRGPACRFTSMPKYLGKEDKTTSGHEEKGEKDSMY